MRKHSFVFLAYSWLVVATTWNWIQDGFKTFTERSEEILQESLGSLRELTSNAPRIYSAFGTLEISDKGETVNFSDDDLLAVPIEDGSDGLNYEIGLGDSSSHVSSISSSSDEIVPAIPEPKPEPYSPRRTVVFGYGDGDVTVLRENQQSISDAMDDEDRSCNTRGCCWPFSCS